MTTTQNPRPPSTTDPLPALRCGDALDVLRELGANSVDAVITDPPYGLDRSGAMVGQVNDNYHLRETHGRGYADSEPEAYLAWCRRWIAECERVLKPGAYLLSFAGARSVDLVGFAARQCGFDIRDQMTWARQGSASRGRKVILPDGRTLSTTICPAHEPIVCAQKRCEGTFADNFARWGTGFINVSDSVRWRGTPPRWPRTVFDYPKARGAERRPLPEVSHPTVKPVALMRELVRLYSPPGGLVVDPFAGSGSTVEAAILEGRQYVAIERHATCVRMIQARVDRAAGQVHGDR